MKFRFRNFQMYKDARNLATTVKNFSREKFPPDENFGLRSQLWRALDSIILNIAEGADRSTDKDFASFLNKAHTSLNEVVACLDISCDNGYSTATETEKHINDLEELSNQITAFRKKLLIDDKTTTQK